MPKSTPKPSQPPPEERQAFFRAQFELLDQVRSFVAQAAQDCGLEEADIYAVQMAVDEAFTNIVEHAYGGECQEEVKCTCRVEKDVLTVTLRDCGRPFNPDTVPDPDLDASLEEREIGGLGLYFMRQLMDDVEFKFHPGEGGNPGCNILTMVKRKEKTA